MKTYTIVAFVGLPEVGNWQKKTAYIRIRDIQGPSARKALASFEMDKYDKSLGYVIHSKRLRSQRYVLLPNLISRIVYWIQLNFL
jgi:hypothetical protein